MSDGAADSLPPVRWERFVHRDSDGPLIVGRDAHEAAGLAKIYEEVERTPPRELIDGFFLRGVTETYGRAIWNAEIGELITDRGFLSVTSDLHPEIVEALATLDDAVLLQIQPYVGAKAIVAHEVLPDSGFAHELETIIQRSSTLQIVRKHRARGLQVVDVVLAYQPDTPPPIPGDSDEASESR